MVNTKCEQEVTKCEMTSIYFEKFKRVESNKNYVMAHFDDLRDRFPDEHVAVVNQSVKFHEKDFDVLLAKIHADCKPNDGVFVFFIRAKRDVTSLDVICGLSVI